MSLESGLMLRRLLKLRDGEERILKTRENTQIEFKRSFNLGSMPKYARTMAAYANTDGGFIVYGVKNAPHELVGINLERFEATDPAKVTSFLNAHCSPEIQWEMGTLEVSGTELGFIYTHVQYRKPVITTTSSGEELKEGEIYYRYRGQTTSIRYAELRALIDELLDEERRGWVQHLSTISKAGAMNVAVLDTLQGKLFGAGAPFLIDERLLRQVKFIREGHFTESAGTPALRLVGDVRTVAGVTTAQVVQRGIHFDDLLTAFLANRPLSEDDAKSYLHESCYQMSPYSPVFYFARQAHLTDAEAAELVDQAECGLHGTRAALVRRLRGEKRTAAQGVVDQRIGSGGTSSSSDVETRLAATKTVKARRSVLWQVLTVAPEALPPVALTTYAKPLLEALTNLDRTSCLMHADALRQMLLGLYGAEFSRLDGLGQTGFRKAVAYLDEQLNGLAVR